MAALDQGEASATILQRFEGQNVYGRRRKIPPTKVLNFKLELQA